MLLLLACDSEEPVDAAAERAALTRLSVDLRGVHPSEDELVAVASNPALYAEFVDRYLDDPRYLVRMREVFNQRFLTRTGDTYFDLPPSLNEEGVVADAIAEEPLRLLTYILENDLPYSTMVTATHTMADPVLAEMWDLDREAGEGWTKATWTDGRPAAGLLSMTTIWQRYPSMGGNANRHRANAISKMLLCDDYLSRPIVLDRAAVDLLTIDPENAIAVTPTCQSCHATLDPLAANLFGFYHYDAQDDRSSAITYRPENEEEWRAYAGKEPGFYGRPTSNLPELGVRIASDDRFHDCAVRTVWEGLSQTPYTDAAWEEVAGLRAAYDASGGQLTPVVRAYVTTDAYRNGETRVVSPAQLASVVEDVTGYAWTFDDRPGLLVQDMGLPVLAGGIDSRFVTTRSDTPTLGMALVQERIAQAAAAYVAENDLAEGRVGDAILLRYVTVADTPATAADAFDAQIRYLYLHITGEALADDAPEPAALAAMWTELMEIDASPTDAWAGVVSVVLRDPRVIFY